MPARTADSWPSEDRAAEAGAAPGRADRDPAVGIRWRPTGLAAEEHPAVDIQKAEMEPIPTAARPLETEAGHQISAAPAPEPTDMVAQELGLAPEPTDMVAQELAPAGREALEPAPANMPIREPEPVMELTRPAAREMVKVSRLKEALRLADSCRTVRKPRREAVMAGRTAARTALRTAGRMVRPGQSRTARSTGAQARRKALHRHRPQADKRARNPAAAVRAMPGHSLMLRVRPADRAAPPRARALPAARTHRVVLPPAPDRPAVRRVRRAEASASGGPRSALRVPKAGSIRVWPTRVGKIGDCRMAAADRRRRPGRS